MLNSLEKLWDLMQPFLSTVLWLCILLICINTYLNDVSTYVYPMLKFFMKPAILINNLYF